MRTAVVLEGQGLANAFTCAVLYQWLEAGLVPDGMVAASQAVLPAVYFRSGQKEALEALYDRAFTGGTENSIPLLFPRTGLEKRLPQLAEDLPVDMDAWKASKLPLYGVYTRADNGDATAFSLDGKDDWRQLRHFIDAATARPADRQPVMLNEHTYFDAALSRPLPIEETLEAGFDAVVVVRTLPKGQVCRRKVLSPRELLALQNWPNAKNTWQLAHLYIHAAEKALMRLETQGRAVVLRPERENHHTYGYGHSAAADYYMQGLQAAESSLEQVAHLLQS